MECLLGQRTSACAASIPLARGVTERRDLCTKKAGTRRTDRCGYAKAAGIPKRNVVIDGITDVFLITSPLEVLGRSAPVQWTEGASITM
jgi:hypothetical protein